MDCQEGPPGCCAASKPAIQLFIHWDQGFWPASHFFLITQSIFVLAFAAIAEEGIANSETLLGHGLVWLGFGTAVTWFFVAAKKYAFVRGAEDIVEGAAQCVYRRVRLYQLSVPFSSSRLMRIIPWAFAGVWLAILLVGIPRLDMITSEFELILVAVLFLIVLGLAYVPPRIPGICPPPRCEDE